MLTALVSCVVVEPSNAVDVILSVNGVTLLGGKLGSMKVPPVPAKENIGRQYLIGIHHVKSRNFAMWPKWLLKNVLVESNC